MNKILRWLILLAPFWCAVIGAIIGSHYSSWEQVAHFTTPEVNSYMKLELVSHTPDGLLYGMGLGFVVWVYAFTFVKNL